MTRPLTRKDFAAIVPDVLAVALVALLLLAASGCQGVNAPVAFRQDARPMNRVASAREVWTDAVNTAYQLAADGVVAESTVTAYVDNVKPGVHAALDAAEAAARSGGDVNPGIERVRLAVGQLKSFLQARKGGK